MFPMCLFYLSVISRFELYFINHFNDEFRNSKFVYLFDLFVCGCLGDFLVPGPIPALSHCALLHCAVCWNQPAGTISKLTNPA